MHLLMSVKEVSLLSRSLCLSTLLIHSTRSTNFVEEPVLSTGNISVSVVPMIPAYVETTFH